jgi:small subunit ribosomal protein S20
MANTSSAKKNVRKNEVRRVRNGSRRSAVKSAIKKLYASLETKAGHSDIQSLLKDIAAKLSRAAHKNVIHRNTASRKLSRLAKRVNQVSASPQA